MTRLTIRQIHARLMADPRVDDVEDEGIAEPGRFFVHLKRQWYWSDDPWDRSRQSKSFASFSEAKAGLRKYVGQREG
jgi:hypothetical protein